MRHIFRIVLSSLFFLWALGFVPPAAEAAEPSFSAAIDAGGVLRVIGSDERDKLYLTVSESVLVIDDLATPTPADLTFPLLDLSAIEVHARGGDDHIGIDANVAQLGLPMEIQGGDGADRIIAGPQPPEILLTNAQDRLVGLLTQIEELRTLAHSQLLERSITVMEEANTVLVEPAATLATEAEALMLCPSSGYV